jgi:hypothetical protein
MKRVTSKSSPRWRVIRIGGAKAREICELQAKTAEDAVKRVIREYPVPSEDHYRLKAIPVGQ